MERRQSQGESSPETARKPKRIDRACCQCRRRKSKCKLVEDLPERTCERCEKAELECKFMSVADEERMKLHQNSAHDNSAVSLASIPGTTSIQNPGTASPQLGSSSNTQAGMPASESDLFTPAFVPMYSWHISPANPTMNPPYDASHHQGLALGQLEGDSHDMEMWPWQAPGLENHTPFQPGNINRVFPGYDNYQNNLGFDWEGSMEPENGSPSE